MSTAYRDIQMDALLPPSMAEKAEGVGVKKATMDLLPLFALAVLAGAFIGFGAVFATTVSAGASGVLPYGVTRLLVGLVFSLGLILVLVGGAELFTGNNLIVMAWAGGKVSTKLMLRNWLVVYVGNFVGAVGLALMVFYSGYYANGGGEVGASALATATGKLEHGFGEAIVLGILCNILVCLAVWLTFSARTTTDRILAVIFPITAFVAAGFEHSVANMYFIPIGLFIKNFDPAFLEATATAAAELSWGGFFLKNLIPVTIGNIIGGSLFVGLLYWTIYLKPCRNKGGCEDNG
ncbi:MAG: formate/nitrite transporter family protein [Spirochaetota bacterium]